jgi:hypothetical protein
MIRDVNPGSGFFSNPDPGVKKAPDPGSTTAKRYSEETAFQYSKSKPVLSPKKQLRNFLEYILAF